MPCEAMKNDPHDIISQIRGQINLLNCLLIMRENGNNSRYKAKQLDNIAEQLFQQVQRESRRMKYYDY
jgi:hypothetical protein